MNKKDGAALLRKAVKFAETAHKNQERKYTGDPYFIHCAEVALIVTKAGLSQECIAAAWLHDTVEDTDTTFDDIEREFGKKVKDLVYWLTDKSKPEDGNRKTRKEIDRNHYASAPPNAQSIKYADLISNTESIAKYDKDFARVYMKEKKALLDVMDKGDSSLYKQARNIVEDYYRKHG